MDDRVNNQCYNKRTNQFHDPTWWKWTINKVQFNMDTRSVYLINGKFRFYSNCYWILFIFCWCKFVDQLNIKHYTISCRDIYIYKNIGGYLIQLLIESTVCSRNTTHIRHLFFFSSLIHCTFVAFYLHAQIILQPWNHIDQK